MFIWSTAENIIRWTTFSVKWSFLISYDTGSVCKTILSDKELVWPNDISGSMSISAKWPFLPNDISSQITYTAKRLFFWQKDQLFISAKWHFWPGEFRSNGLFGQMTYSAEQLLAIWRFSSFDWFEFYLVDCQLAEFHLIELDVWAKRLLGEK